MNNGKIVHEPSNEKLRFGKEEIGKDRIDMITIMQTGIKKNLLSKLLII